MATSGAHGSLFQSCFIDAIVAIYLFIYLSLYPLCYVFCCTFLQQIPIVSEDGGTTRAREVLYVLI